ncbi:hypothetical protein OV450_3324 [Actinobacteria bacterium OV450]|nr:hypothetical protein OV450_3324 [Actinobacteria bacterium OV450]
MPPAHASVSTLWPLLRGTGRGNWAVIHADIAKVAADTETGLTATGAALPLPPPVRDAVRRRTFALWHANQVILITTFVIWGALAAAWASFGHWPAPARGALQNAGTVQVVLAAAVLMYAPSYVMRWWISLRGAGRTHAYRQYAPVASALRLIRCCSALATAPAGRRHARAADVSRALRTLERTLLAAPGRTGSIPRSSPRRRNARLHARLVVSALRRAEAGLDTDRAAAVRDLSGLALTVAERHAEGRYAALLPDEELAGLDPAADWIALRETLHLAGALLLVGAVGWAGAWAGGRLGVEAPWTLVPAAVAAVIAFPRLRANGPDLLLSFLSP